MTDNLAGALNLSVVHLAPRFPAYGHQTVIGGYSSTLRHLAIAQATMGLRVEVIAGGGHPSYYWDKSQVEVTWVSPRKPTVAKEAYSFIARLLSGESLQKLRTADVVHMHFGAWDYLTAAALILARARPNRAVISLYCPPYGPVLSPRFGLRAIGKRAIPVATSQHIAREAGKLLPQWPATRVIPPAIHMVRQALPRAHGRHLRLLFVGNLSEAKNVKGLLRAISRLQLGGTAVRLHVTTELERSSTGDQHREVRSLVSDLGLEDSVEFSQVVDDMPSLMQGMHVVVLPFLDTFGPSDYFIAGLEALALGVPVVASAKGAMPEVRSEGLYLVDNPTSTEELARAILAASQHDGGVSLPASFHADRVAAEFLGLYLEKQTASIDRGRLRSGHGKE